MPLGNAKMQAILREYDQTREKNRNILAKRMAEAEAKAPAYFDYHKQIISLCMQRAGSALFPETSASISFISFIASIIQTT